MVLRKNPNYKPTDEERAAAAKKEKEKEKERERDGSAVSSTAAKMSLGAD